MTLDLRPLSPVLGAEIRGIDLRSELAPDVVAVILGAWREHAVLLFRDQHLSVDDQIRFTRHFGEVAGSGAEGSVRKDPVLMLGNYDIPGQEVSKYALGEMQYHQDGVYAEEPTKATFLFALEVPERGGNTCFSSTGYVYEHLPEELRARVDLLDARFNYYTNMKRGVDEVREFVRPEMVHPIVIAHPETGRPAMLCNRLMTDSIVGLPADESAALLEELYGYLEDPGAVYEHVWRAGDLVVWDNLATAHARTWYDPTHRRMMQRTTVRGTRPVAYRARAAVARA